jgi:hypothetical protein
MNYWVHQLSIQRGHQTKIVNQILRWMNKARPDHTKSTSMTASKQQSNFNCIHAMGRKLGHTLSTILSKGCCIGTVQGAAHVN